MCFHAGAARLVILVLAVGICIADPAPAQSEKKTTDASPSLSGHTVVLDSRGGTQITKLGRGRGRLRIPFEALKPAALDDAGRVVVAPPSFLVDWLRQDLPGRFPGVERVELVETIVSRDTGEELLVSRRRDLEIHGEEKILASVRSWVLELLQLRDVTIVAEVSLVERRFSGEAVPPVKVELLGDRALKALLPSFAGARHQVRFDLRQGSYVRQADLQPREFVQAVRVREMPSGAVVVPEIRTSYEGFQGSIGAVLLPGARELALSCDFGLGVLVRPVAGRTVRLLGRDHHVEAPEIVAVRWASDRLVLGPREVAFRISNVVLPVREGEEKPSRRTVDILVQLQVEPSSRRFVLGRVIGFDEEQGLVFSRIHPTVNLQPGRRLSVTRRGRVVGRVEVIEFIGGMTTLKRVKGHVARGDELR